MYKSLFALLFIPSLLAAQTLTVQWDKSIGGNNEDALKAVFEATNGYVIAVGETRSQTQGGTDGIFSVVDHSAGSQMFEKRLGGKGDDGLNGGVQTYNGHFLLAGYTGSNGNGSRDGWLVRVDETGNIVSEKSFGGSGQDEWREILLIPDGTVVLGGYKNNQKDGDIWLAKTDGEQLLWETTIGKGNYSTISGLVATLDGGIVLTGTTNNSSKRRKGDIYILKTDAKGQVLWERFFGEKDWEEALDITPTTDGGFAIAGLTRSKGEGDLDAWLLKLSRDGSLQWDKTFGGKDADMANAVIQTHDGGFVLTGASKSHRSGARQFNNFVVKTDRGGYLQWQDYFGGEKEDIGLAISNLHDGRIVIAGRKSSNSRGSTDGWLVCLGNPYLTNALASARSSASVDVSSIQLGTTEGFLLPGTSNYVSFRLTNQSEFPLTDVQAIVANSAHDQLNIWENNYLGPLAFGETREIRIPVRGATTLQSGEQKLLLQIATGTKQLEQTSFIIKTKMPVPATLQIADFRYEQSRQSDDKTLTVLVENLGDFPTKPVTVEFICPDGMVAKSARKLSLGGLLPHGRKETSLVFEKNSKSDGTGVVCALLENGVEKVRKTLDLPVTGPGIIASGPLLIWTDPAPHELGTNKINRSEDFIEFKMTVVSPNPLNPKDFRLKVNQVEMEGSKFSEEELSPPRKENRQYTYTYRNKIPLKRGQNRLEVVVNDVVSDPLDVTFEPRRSNLHILAVGPSHEDLQFTSKDAGDFAEAFRNQGGPDKLYANVYIRELLLPEETTLTGIQQAFYDLSYMYKDQLITRNDVLLVFISSHGKILSNRFKILQSNYNPKYENISIDFKSDVLDNLNHVECKKLVFLDACHSGAARSKSTYAGLSKALIDLANTQPGVSTLTSCRSTELSYEDQEWENGAFTEAMLEAFGNKTCTDGSGNFQPDTDSDGVLRLGELYDFLQRRVPSLVKEKLPDAPTTQVPFMPENQLDRNIPIYFLRGN